MVCGRCHRERTDHTLSSSGPTRCEYTSHRENCPGGFKSKCFEQQNLESETEYNDTDNEDFVQPSDTMQDILTGLKSLKLNSEQQNDVQPPFNDQLQQLGLSPLQVQQLALLGLKLGQENLPKEDKISSTETAKQSLQNPTTPAQSATASHLGSLSSGPPARTPTQSNHLQGDTMAPNKNSQPSQAGSLQGIEKLVRQLVSDNQQNLQKSQESQAAAYTGPTMTEIRQDSSTAHEVSRIINAIKNVSPVFGQLTSNPPATPTMQGISPLVQLQQQLLSQQQLTAPQPSPQDTLQQLLQQLSTQQSTAVGQHHQQPSAQPGLSALQQALVLNH